MKMIWYLVLKVPKEQQELYSSIAQLVERMTVNHDVVGSSPTWGGKSPKGINQAPWSSG